MYKNSKSPMNLEIHDYPFGERPQNQVPDKRFYELLQEEGIRQLVSCHATASP